MPPDYDERLRQEKVETDRIKSGIQEILTKIDAQKLREVVAFFEVLPTRRDTDLSCLMKLNWLQSHSNSGVLDTTSRCLYGWATPRRRPLPLRDEALQEVKDKGLFVEDESLPTSSGQQKTLLLLVEARKIAESAKKFAR